MSKRAEQTRSQVLAVLNDHGAPLSAYEVLGDMRQVSPKIAPPTVYRALATLIERGQVHRIESMNAFMACKCDRHQTASILSICDDCGTVQESVAPELLQALSSLAGQSGFSTSRHVVELHGQCANCTTAAAST